MAKKMVKIEFTFKSGAQIISEFDTFTVNRGPDGQATYSWTTDNDNDKLLVLNGNEIAAVRRVG